MKLPKGFGPNTNPAMARMLFEQKMTRALELEKELEAKRFTHDTPLVHVVCCGRPKLVELKFHADCNASTVLTAINECLKLACIERDQMAKELIGS